ncbi:DUF6602 domain-containing protein [Planococcus chinensis]|uniref:DUF6602 domain-containing protein n=1 Tax=Planococcus chinensis TaxID=272917 RepID=A0ABW4QHG5_9BACL
MEPNSLNYQKSIAREFNATKDRIRNLIGSAHWGEEGRYKEIILMNFLKRFLPTTIAVGTGFIKSNEKLSSQIDIIIYNPSIAGYFKENDFVIVHPESVYGVIEVKSNPNSYKISEAIDKLNTIGQVTKIPIFNGLFIFGEIEQEVNVASFLLTKPRKGSLFEKSLNDSFNCVNSVNHIVSNDGAFIKKWEKEIEFRSYSISDLATSYFFSNLIEFINIRNNLSNISASMYQHLYPIKEGKEQHKTWTLRFNRTN